MVKTVPRSTVGATLVEVFEGCNDFDVATDVVVEVVVVFGFMDSVSNEPFCLGLEFRFLVLVVVAVVERIRRSSVEVIDVEAYEGRNNFDVVTDVVV